MGAIRVLARLGSGKFDNDPWINTMIKSYLSINSHYSTSHKNWIIPRLKAALQPDYIDSSATGYYYNTFGPSGLNKQVCDFLVCFRSTGNIATRTNYQSAGVTRWNLDGSVVSQTNLPNYTLTGDGFLVVSRTDNWSGITGFHVYSNNFTGNVPKMSLPNAIEFGAHGNAGFTGIFPSHIFPKMRTITFYDTSLNSLGGFAWVNSDLVTINFIRTTIESTSISALLSAINTWMSTHTPTQNLTITGNTLPVAIPQSGSENTDKAGIISKYTAASKTATLNLRNERHVAFGDSITVGVSATNNQGFEYLLAQQLGIAYWNLGASGSILNNVSTPALGVTQVYRANKKYIYSNCLIIIQVGSNDVITDSWYQDYRALLLEIKLDGFNNIIIVSPPYQPNRVTQNNAIKGYLPQLASEFDVQWVNCVDYMEANGGATLLNPDLIHPNDQGHLAMKTCIVDQATININ